MELNPTVMCNHFDHAFLIEIDISYFPWSFPVTQSVSCFMYIQSSDAGCLFLHHNVVLDLLREYENHLRVILICMVRVESQAVADIDIETEFVLLPLEFVPNQHWRVL